MNTSRNSYLNLPNVRRVIIRHQPLTTRDFAQPILYLPFAKPKFKFVYVYHLQGHYTIAEEKTVCGLCQSATAIRAGNMESRRVSVSERNSTCDSTLNDDHNRAILMSFSETLSSTYSDVSRDSLSSTLIENRSTKISSTIVEKTIMERRMPKIIADEVLVEPYPISKKKAFVSRITKFGDKSKRPAEIERTTKKSTSFDVENIRRSGLWPALSAMETSLHAPDEAKSSDDADTILKKLEQDFTSCPGRFTASLVTIIEESFAQSDDNDCDVSMIALVDLVKNAANAGKRLSDESPVSMSLEPGSTTDRKPLRPDRGKLFEVDENESPECLISLPSESRENAELTYPNTDEFRLSSPTVSTGPEKTFKVTKKFSKIGNRLANEPTSVRTISQPGSATHKNPLRSNRGRLFEDYEKNEKTSPKSSISNFTNELHTITDESSYLRLTSPTVSTDPEQTFKVPKKYAKTPRIIIYPASPVNPTRRSIGNRRSRTFATKTRRSPVSPAKRKSVRLLSPLSDDEDEYLTAESETDEVSELSEELSESTRTEELSVKKQLDMSKLRSDHREWVTISDRILSQKSTVRSASSSRTGERTRRVSTHTKRLEMRVVNELVEKRLKCFETVEQLRHKNASDTVVESKIKNSPCSFSPCGMSSEFCMVLAACHEYYRSAMNACEITKRDKSDNRCVATRSKVTVETARRNSPRNVRRSVGKQRCLSNKSPGARSARVSPRNLKATAVDTSSIRPVSQLRQVFSPRSETAGCFAAKTQVPHKTKPKIAKTVGYGKNGPAILLRGHKPSHYRDIKSPVGEYIRGKKAAQPTRP